MTRQDEIDALMSEIENLSKEMADTGKPQSVAPAKAAVAAPVKIAAVASQAQQVHPVPATQPVKAAPQIQTQPQVQPAKAAFSNPVNQASPVNPALHLKAVAPAQVAQAPSVVAPQVLAPPVPISVPGPVLDSSKTEAEEFSETQTMGESDDVFTAGDTVLSEDDGTELLDEFSEAESVAAHVDEITEHVLEQVMESEDLTTESADLSDSENEMHEFHAPHNHGEESEAHLGMEDTLVSMKDDSQHKSSLLDDSHSPSHSQAGDVEPGSLTMTLSGQMSLKLRYEFGDQEVTIGFVDHALHVKMSDGTEFKIPVGRLHSHKKAA